MATLTVQGGASSLDTYIRSDQPTTNKDAGPINVGEPNTGAAVYRGLIKFDISSIPAGSTINSATLTLNHIEELADNTRTMRIYRVLRAWSETQCTWNVYTTGNNWGTAGCSNTTTDREATDIGTISLSSTEANGTKDITLTASKIQEMITGGSFTNNGFLLQMDTETNDDHGFDSKDTGTAPKLVINYTPPPSFFILF